MKRTVVGLLASAKAGAKLTRVTLSSPAR